MNAELVVTIISGLLMMIGIIGAVVQVWPSGPFIAGGILLWAITVNTGLAWGVFIFALLILGVAFVAKYVIPGRKLIQTGIPHATLIWGLVGAVAGFFFIPVLGFVIGMVVALYVAEYVRLQSTELAWASTLEALKVVGLSIVIELLAALVATSAWIAALISMALSA